MAEKPVATTDGQSRREDRDRQHKLQRAAQLIKEATVGLDTSEHVCPTCGLRVKENFDEFSIFDGLNSIVGKLQRATESLQSLKDEESDERR